MQIAGGDMLFVKEILQVIHDELPVEILAYQQSINNIAFAEAASNVHKIKHKIAILGMDEGVILATIYENQLKKGNRNLENAFQDLLSDMTIFINQQQFPK